MVSILEIILKTMYTYIRSEPQLWTVGFYGPNEKWNPESDWDSSEEAAKRVAYLNGGSYDISEMAVSVSQRVTDIYNAEFFGHPSREEENKAQEAIFFLAEQIDILHKLRINKT
jgi:hypothetical protein